MKIPHFDVSDDAPPERGGRWIKHNDGSKVPLRMMFFDTETNEEPSGEESDSYRLTLRLGCLSSWVRSGAYWTRAAGYDFTSIDEFWEWLVLRLSSRQQTWVFAHNLVFDLTVMQFWKFLDSGEWHIWEEDDLRSLKELAKSGRKPFKGFFCDNDPPTIINCRHRSGKKVIFVDTMNYFPCSVEDLGKSIKLSKLKQPAFSASDAKWQAYCKRDVEVIEQATLNLVRWWRRQDMGLFRYTTPALALGAWRHQYMDKHLHRHGQEEVRLLERRANYSGKLQLNYHGTYRGPVYELDCNGLYPYVLKEERYPVELWDWWSNPDGDGECFPHACDYVVADVLVDTVLPMFPLRTKQGTIWPTGRFWTTLCGPELKKAMIGRCVKQQGRWARYRMGRPFRRYVDRFWAERLEARAGKHSLPECFFKLMGNSLHGKLGQLTAEWKNVYASHELPELRRWRVSNSDTGEKTQFRRVGRRVQKQVDRVDAENSVVPVCAWTTSYARCYMDYIADCVGRENVLYQVSDALYLTEDGKNWLTASGMVDTTTLGRFKIGKQGKTAEFTGLHKYRVGRHHVNGAMPRKKRDLGDGSFEEVYFPDLSTILAHDPPDGMVIYKRIRNYSDCEGHVKPGKGQRVGPLEVKLDTDGDHRNLENGVLPTLL